MEHLYGDITTMSRIYVLNGYDAESGEFLPSYFVHISRISTPVGSQFFCTCPMYTWLQQKALSLTVSEDDYVAVDGITCMHCRFIRDDIEPKLSELLQPNEVLSELPVVRKLLAVREHCNTGAVLLSPRSGTTLKFPVLASSGLISDCCFVHLSCDGSFIHCQSGECQASQSKRKKPQVLIGEAPRGLCRHLEAMRANLELWQHLIPSQTQQTVSDNAECDEEEIDLEVNDNNEESENVDFVASVKVEIYFEI